MKPAHSLIPLAFAFAVPALAAQPAAANDPRFAVVLQPAMVEFHVAQSGPAFFGVVLVSTSPNLQHFLVGLPPLLQDAVILDVGLSNANGEFATRFRDTVFPAGIAIYAQGVTLSEAGIRSSDVDEFTLDVTFP